MSIPASRRRTPSSRSTSSGSTSAVPGTISPCSPTAISVGIGIVFTVSGATSSSTYFVSL